MKFIHTADLHLDSPFRGLTDMPTTIWEKVHQSTFLAFQKIVDAAIEQHVDFVLIVGDIYDRDHHSAEAEDFFIRQCQRLSKEKIPVYLSYGNHDYQIVSSQSEGFPENVHVFGNQVETSQFTTRDGQTVAITGFSYQKRWLPENQVTAFPKKGNVDWQIGMLHGAIRQNDVNQDHYAPFTLDELQAKNYDYWALGHIHKHQLLNEMPPVVYPGDPQGRHKNENGQHGYYLVQSHEHQLVPQFNAVAPIEWHTIPVSIDEHLTNDLLLEKLLELGEKTASFNMVAFDLQGTAEIDSLTKQLINNGSVLERLQDKLIANGTPHWWPYQINLQDKLALPKMTDLDQDYWDQSAKETFNRDDVVELAGKLTKYNFIAERLQDSDFITELRQAATRQLEEGDDNED
jgi:DNA repair exonuclease SbcCD nuclease subunit